MITRSAHESVSTFFAADGEYREQEIHSEKETPEQTLQRLLIVRASQGDQEAFATIVNQYSMLMLRTACKALRISTQAFAAQPEKCC